ncbi:MAG: hypothetical protein KGL35_31760, partial [Bradyrhizobium sp.]|nr:hypothetical protein [Bradyrhizobium sp.]
QDGVTWGPWQRWVWGEYLGMRFRARMSMISNDGQTEAVLSRFTFGVAVPDRIDHYSSLSIPAGGLTLTFQRDGTSTPLAFNGGPGNTANPHLQGFVVGASQGDTMVLSAMSLSSCTLQVLNGGVGVARTASILVEGY